MPGCREAKHTTARKSSVIIHQTNIQCLFPIFLFTVLRERNYNKRETMKTKNQDNWEHPVEVHDIQKRD